MNIKVGDVCELIAPPGALIAAVAAPFVGEECVVTELCVDMHVSGAPLHAITTRSGGRLAATSDCLRKRRGPPMIEGLDTVTPNKRTTWAGCPWRPAGVEA
jgi:hypothetical protein